MALTWTNLLRIILKDSVRDLSCLKKAKPAADFAIAAWLREGLILFPYKIQVCIEGNLGHAPRLHYSTDLSVF